MIVEYFSVKNGLIIERPDSGKEQDDLIGSLLISVRDGTVRWFTVVGNYAL
jgi:hypothetical protein